MSSYIIGFLVLAVVGGGLLFFNNQNQFDIPSGTTESLEEHMEETTHMEEDEVTEEVTTEEAETSSRRTHEREVFVTDGVKHSIPLNQVLSGGPPKDGIPSIDNPKFIDVIEGNSYVSNDDIGLGVTVDGESRFYPYNILVWHEIVNDTIQGKPVLVTYCPLCATGIVFERVVNGKEQEFGVSGRLWQSNLLMYNRADKEENESLWSQVLGEAVLGPNTGEKLAIVRSDTVRWGDWKKLHPDTKVLSRDTGALRSYGVDPYGDYYTNESVSFGATFNDDRLHPKAFVLGVEIDGKFKAYHIDAIPEGTSTDTFQGETITLTKSAAGEVGMSIDGIELPYIGGFWFSWLAVHPETELFK